MNKVYGYGIIDKDGKPYWAEDCVCENREPLDDVCKDLNTFDGGSIEHGHRLPYRVVKLYRVAKK